MKETFFSQHKEGMYISQHHKHPYTLPVQKVLEGVCEKVRKSLEAFGTASCKGCKDTCITKK